MTETSENAPGPADQVTVVDGMIRRVDSRGGRPGAATVLDVETAKVVVFEFAEGDELHDHAAHHPIIIQTITGRVELTLPDRTVELAPGSLIHLTPMIRHAVRAKEQSTLTVTMLLPHPPRD